jgi:membrane protein required for colicin V production
MTVIDWGILIVMFLSTLIGLWRGAVREVISLATWVLAILVGLKYNHLLVHFYSAFTTHEPLQLGASFLTLVILVVIVGTILGTALSAGISKIGLGPLDKVLGLGFGFIRSVLLIAIVILFAKQTELPSNEEWKQSQLLPQFDRVVDYINEWIKSMGYHPFDDKPQTKSE